MNMTLTTDTMTAGTGRFNLWRRLSLSRKLLVAFGAAFLLALVIAASGLFGLNRVQGSYENALSGGLKIQNRSDHLGSQFLEARRREKDFLLNWKTEGYDLAYSNYVAPNQDYTADMRATIQELNALAPTLDRNPLRGYSQAQYESDLVTLNQEVVIYDDSFLAAVKVLGQRGFVDTGLEGEFRKSVQAIEAKIYDRPGLEPLVVTMLQIRRREKDYLLRGDQQYVTNVHEFVTQLKDQVTASELLQTGEKTEIRTLADDYLVKFDDLVAKDVEVAAKIEEVRAAAFAIQRSINRVESAGEELAVQDIQTAKTNNTQTFTITAITVILALIGTLILASVLSRQITRPVTQLTNTAREIAAGRFNTKAEVNTSDEIGTLAQTFNTMTDRLGAAFEDVRRRGSELATVAEVGTLPPLFLIPKGFYRKWLT
ncbi:MAG: HAMP domain-containing protein [Chloroflexota bacterium]